MIFLLPLLLTASSAAAASGVQLVEHFECGSESVMGSTAVAEHKISGCNHAVKDDANLCCKEHDFCYEAHSLSGHTRDYCDERFCNCLQDVQDRSKAYECKNTLIAFCMLAQKFGQAAFDQAVPSVNTTKFAKFVDLKPLGLDMQRLVDTCSYTRGIAVHCHNTVYKCLQGKHERFKRLMDVVEHSYEDCRSTLYDCMQVIIENDNDENCTSIAQSIAKQANTYMELDEAKHGRSIIETYPIVAARLIKQCNQSQIEPCLHSFHDCAEHHRESQPEVYNAARKIKIGCHLELSACFWAATEKEAATSEDCMEARNLAVGRIRYRDLHGNSLGGNILGAIGIGGRRRRM